MMRRVAFCTTAVAMTPAARALQLGCGRACPPAAAAAIAPPCTSARGLFTSTPLCMAPSEPFTDPDMTHFRRTTTPHPLYEKPATPAAGAPQAAHDPRRGDLPNEWTNPVQNTVWTKEEVQAITRTHRPPKDLVDRIALLGIQTLRFGFDVVSGYKFGRLTPTKILRRILFLETAAGIPGMVAGSLRHLLSLRRMQRDYGWIHTLLEEAENERMHMLVFMKRYNPGLFFRGAVLITQGVFWNVFFIAYLISPRLCHRFVGYLEEEAVRTYTHIIEVMESDLPCNADVAAMGKTPADEIAIRYWKLPKDAKMLDVVYAVRADEANHRDVNHTFASLKRDQQNPFLEHKSGSAGEFVQKKAADAITEEDGPKPSC
eukprot:CAMPEP_0174878488 /NCGR_PEP_ID=MMETSP1114-20130205/82780_1 /TAXON_ID=312471 /ORGANISM="Neobodo designis, Strain CCAP 1951/1" /LENGTH=372 /DNA_ID=CAMNT_0016113877 /DNA_START=72 /DNA_END=1190 /DNA_ORIENTATION=+